MAAFVTNGGKFVEDDSGTTASGVNEDTITAMLLQPDGRIVLVGSIVLDDSRQDDFSVQRYNADGSDDTSFFGPGGFGFNFSSVLVNGSKIDSSDVAFAVALQPDGKLLVAGDTFLNNVSNPDSDFALARFNSDGTVDKSFGTNGAVITDFGYTNDHAYSVIVEPDGEILVAGASVDVTADRTEMSLVRYNADGTLDSTFAHSGQNLISFGSAHVSAFAAALQANGSIILAGAYVSGLSVSMLWIRLTPDGNIDPTFFNGAAPINNFGGQISASDVVVQANGKLLLSGELTVNGVDKILVARYNPDGTLDTSFNQTGFVTASLGGDDETGYKLALQADGKIVVVADSFDNGHQNFVAVRYDTHGVLDPTFGNAGVAEVDFGKPAYASDVAIQADGKIVLSGFTQTTSTTTDVAAARLNMDGSLDTGLAGTPGNDVKVSTLLNDSFDGGAGTDTFVYVTPYAGHTLAKTANGFTVTSSTDGTDTLANVERLKFSDVKLALDLGTTQSAGKSVLLMGATLGAAFPTDKSWAGLFLQYFDSGASVLDGANLLVSAGVMSAFAGGSDNASLVRFVWHNVFDSTPDAPTLAANVAALDAHTETQAEWLANMALSFANQVHVGLAGYAQSGWQYV